MDLGLKSKVAVVTGASKGIGLAVTKASPQGARSQRRTLTASITGPVSGEISIRDHHDDRAGEHVEDVVEAAVHGGDHHPPR